jgi:hypothetical protein
VSALVFDRYITVDWSAANRPKPANQGKDSIWIADLVGDGEPDTINPTTRLDAEVYVRNQLIEARDQAQRVLVGFDFPYGYPSGLAAALGLPGLPWRAVWDHLEREVHDGPRNMNNRFDIACAINSRLPHHVFWGCPPAHASLCLSSRKDLVCYRIEEETVGLSEWRRVERLLHNRRRYPKSTWQLFGAGSVGGQALTGIPVVSRLRRDPELVAISKVWPFEVMTPDLPEYQPAIVHAEIWPSLFPIVTVPDQVWDETQVVGLSKSFRDSDRGGSLSRLFAAADPQATDEGWILGVE